MSYENRYQRIKSALETAFQPYDIVVEEKDAYFRVGFVVYAEGRLSRFEPNPRGETIDRLSIPGALEIYTDKARKQFNAWRSRNSK